MSQYDVQLPVVSPIAGGNFFPYLNKALETLGTDFAGPDDPAARAWPFSTWADTGNLLFKRRNAANSAWVVEGKLLIDGSKAINIDYDHTASGLAATNAQAAIDEVNTFVANDPRVKTALNAPGSAPVFACRAWASIVGNTSPATIRGSGNISSVVRNSVGNYTFNFATAMPSANYAVLGSTSALGGSMSVAGQTTTAFTVVAVNDTGTFVDGAIVGVTVFGG